MGDNNNFDSTITSHKEQKVEGIGGWLTVFVVYICIVLLFAAYNALFTYGRVTFPSIINFVVIVVYILALIAIKIRLEAFPKFMTTVFVLTTFYNVVVLIINLFRVTSVFSFANTFLYAIITIGIVIAMSITIPWIVYLNKSDRVYNTFIHSWRHDGY